MTAAVQAEELLPPWDMHAEQVTLGAVMLVPAALAEVTSRVTPSDFYRSAHEDILTAALALDAQGKPVDTVTVAEELLRRGQLMRMGGAPYLHTLISTVPTTVNATVWADIVKAKSLLRGVLQVGQYMQQKAYAADEDAGALVERVRGKLDELAQSARGRIGLRRAHEVADAAVDRYGDPNVDSTLATGWADLDSLLNGGLRPGTLTVVAARPGVGKSIMGVNLAVQAGKRGCGALLASLEMTEAELADRILAQIGTVELDAFTSREFSDYQWGRVQDAYENFHALPLWITDDPALTITAIGSLARDCRRDGLGLLVVDYLQLVTPADTRVPRHEQVGAISRSLKLLAKQLEMPVVALAQLNRGPEQRTEKRPVVSDLRESGCMTADTTILRADTGAPITFRELMESGPAGIQVWSLDERRRMVAAPLTAVFPSGEKPVYQLTLTSGRTVTATANHPFRTFGGWTPLGDLQPGSRIAVPRQIPPPTGAGLGWNEHRIGLLAHLIGDGCVLARQPLHYTSEDPANLEFVEEAAMAEFGIAGRRVAQGRWQHTYLPTPYRLARGRRNPIVQWFHDLDIAGLRSYEKRLPAALYAASDEEVRIFLRHLWATDGCVFIPAGTSKRSSTRIYYSTSSRALADGVVHMLGRLGLATRLYLIKQRRSVRPSYHVSVAGVRDCRRFCAEVGVHGLRGAKATAYLAHTNGIIANTNVDTLPIDVWTLVKQERARAGFSERALQAGIGMSYSGSTLYRSCPSRERLARIAEVLNSTELRSLATDDVLWDQVVSVEPLGVQPVYDATVEGTHNFIADGVAAHNSIEQDADGIWLLHHDQEEPSQLEVHVAKNRAGRTGIARLAWQPQFARATSLSRSEWQGDGV